MGAVVPTPQVSTPQVSKPQVSKPSKRGKSENRGVQTSKAEPTGEAQQVPVPQKQKQAPPVVKTLSTADTPVLQNWAAFLSKATVPVTPGVPA